MARRYLLDTNIVSDLVRDPQGKVAQRIEEHGEHSICTSIVVASELRYGGAKSDSTALRSRIDLLLSALEVLPLEEPADRRYAELRDTLTRQGMTIGPNDLLIAAHALAADLTVVTANVGEFSRVPGLAVENWLAP
ncbi:MAG: type II toxin-antitoxin system VapC family toxin [Acidobacteria bacterium]|nr:MAG: type II toxin-antitoxin system VapC family toxin [Acidobacteriota bacterium]REK09634.1 MAG: type II toxin-antitoxin system VapC family toxin [Acidobacteriota bacterium]